MHVTNKYIFILFFNSISKFFKFKKTLSIYNIYYYKTLKCIKNFSKMIFFIYIEKYYSQ